MPACRNSQNNIQQGVFQVPKMAAKQKKAPVLLTRRVYRVNSAVMVEEQGGNLCWGVDF
jgi:hypothetical protein